MRATYGALFFSLSLLAGSTLTFAAEGAANATWNAGVKNQGDVTFGIYDKEGSCESLKSALPIRVGMKNLKAGAPSGPLQVTDLRFCLFFFADPTPGSPDAYDADSCGKVRIEFSYDAQANEYRGKYDLTMKRQAVRRGEFRAQYCEREEAEKK